MLHACPFCRKLAGVEPWPAEDVVWQFPHSVAVLGPWQYYHGYCIVVARRHARELGDLEPAERRAYLEEMCILARALEHTFTPRKLNYELLGNQVLHPHWHLFPRYEADPEHLKPVWVALDRAERDVGERTRFQTGPVPRIQTIQRIQTTLASLTPDPQ
jgi:diadenosine tetraphosphate (Ap4A) HIT family hydrolase